VVCKYKTHYLIPRAFTRLVHPPGFTAAYPANYPAPTSRLVTRRPLERSANARPYFIPRALTRLVRPLGFTAAYPANYPAPTSQLCYPESSRVVCKRKTHCLVPRAFTRLVRPLGFTAAYPAPRFWLRFWLLTLAVYPAPTSRLVTRRPLERSANARPYFIPRALTRLVRPLGFTAAYSAPNLSRLPTGYPAPTSQQPNEML